MPQALPMEQRTGTAALLAIIAAVGSFIATFTGHPGWGLLLAVISLPLGGLGLVFAASPRVSGGVLSITSIVLGCIALVIAILGVIGTIIF